jgi:hypothetical protein
LGGRWSKPSWVFDVRDEVRVRELCKEVYGTDGTSSDLVTLKVTVSESDSTYDLSYYVAGRQVARAFDRDGGARLGEDVVVLEGGFYSTGSRKNPALGVKEGTVIEVRDVPRAAVEKLPEGWEAVIVDETVDRAALEAELRTIEERAAEIRRILGQGVAS